MSDVRDALRALRATPVISAVAILSLALGIGANTAIFSIVDSLMLRSLPVKEPQRLVLLTDGSWTNPIWEQIRNRVYGARAHEGTEPGEPKSEEAARGTGAPANRIFAGAFAWSDTRFNLSESGQTEFANGIWASGHFFDVLGVPRDARPHVHAGRRRARRRARRGRGGHQL